MQVSTGSTFNIENMYDTVNGFLMNTNALIIVSVVLIIYILFFVSLGNSSSLSLSTSSQQILPSISSTSSKSGFNSISNIVIIVIIIMLLILLLVNVLQYFFGLNIMASIKNLFSEKPIIDIQINPILPIEPSVVPEIRVKKQVFNIPGNNYGYNDAKSLCSAYGARLATYDEIENSYNHGGEWCNYGWSDGQMALFPTQKSTFENLQKIQGHENDCGRPGVNGGYIGNPQVKFGVNCYGYKPKITTEEEEMMLNTSPYPKTNKDIAMEERVDYWKSQLDEILVSPFGYNKWSA